MCSESKSGLHVTKKTLIGFIRDMPASEMSGAFVRTCLCETLVRTLVAFIHALFHSVFLPFFLKHLPNVQAQFSSPQAPLSLDCHCRMKFLSCNRHFGFKKSFFFFSQSAQVFLIGSGAHRESGAVAAIVDQLQPTCLALVQGMNPKNAFIRSSNGA